MSQPFVRTVQVWVCQLHRLAGSEPQKLAVRWRPCMNLAFVLKTLRLHGSRGLEYMILC